ncbi:protein kinase domain-containing protein [Streptomyces sp. 24-1644]|uniref:protein kinase domain-containing protein n=1 Tax=Streptomyces sp. 24-1644 TaxID=3457315 RepID=UPI003FA6ABD8
MTLKFGEIDLYLEFSLQQRCDQRCQDAIGDDCVCSCLGENHGGAAYLRNWTQVAETNLVGDPEVCVRHYRVRRSDVASEHVAPYEARGERKDYACDKLPFHSQENGMADVFHATHKATSTPVVLKKLHDKNPPLHKKARMAREILAGRILSGHPNAMPVWDAGPDSTWFVMPVAQATAMECPDELKDPTTLRALVDSLCSVLSAAHDAHDQGASHGWVHRDIKPANVLRLDGRWVLADWGLTRRPAGQTTHPQRTRAGASMGSEGFAAPELSIDAHSAGPTADIYSLGQLIGWAVTGRAPQQNIPLIPESGPWRAVVRAATRTDPGRRPATVRAFLGLVAQRSRNGSGGIPCQGAQPRPDLVLGVPLVPQGVPGERTVAGFLQQVQVAGVGRLACDGEEPQDDGVDLSTLR